MYNNAKEFINIEEGENKESDPLENNNKNF